MNFKPHLKLVLPSLFVAALAVPAAAQAPQPAAKPAPAKPAATAPAKPAAAAPAKPAAAPAAASPTAQATLLGQFGDWGAYTATPGGRKVCFALSKPTVVGRQSAEPAHLSQRRLHVHLVAPD